MQSFKTLIFPHRMVRETIVRHQPDDLPSLADHDLGIEGKPAYEFNAQLRAADWMTDHKGPRCADVDSIEMLQLFGELRRSKGSVTADVDAPHKNHECHELPPAGASPIRGARPQPTPMAVLSA